MTQFIVIYLKCQSILSYSSFIAELVFALEGDFNLEIIQGCLSIIQYSHKDSQTF